jgi:hypothetical protein
MKISEMSLEDRQRMVNDLSFRMLFYFKIDRESVNEFWETVGLGIEAKKRA